jgi:hypothetical protein
MDVVKTLEESLRLDNELKHKFAMLGAFADRVTQIRSAKAANEQHISTLEQQIAYLKGRLDARPYAIEIDPKMVQDVRMVQARNDWQLLANILEKSPRRVSVVGKTRSDVLTQLEAHLGQGRTLALSKRFRVFRQLTKAPHSSLVIFPTGSQTPESIEKQVKAAGIRRPTSILHQGRVLQVT